MINNTINLLCFSTQHVSKVKVASLNYCSIMNNPFQFYSEEYQQELRAISYGFVKVLELFLPGFKKEKHSWQCARLDQKLRNRYSPLFKLTMGINQSANSFESFQQLQQNWEKAFGQNFVEAGLKKSANFQQQKQNLKHFDFLSFHTLLNFAYNKNHNVILPFSQLLKQPIQPYLQTYRPFHELPFIDQSKKTSIVERDILQDSGPDVLYIQQASIDLIQRLKQIDSYDLIGDDQWTKLLIKKAQFNARKDPSQILQHSIIQILKSIERTALACYDNYVFLAVHFRSAKELAQKQWTVLSNFITEVTSKHPQITLIVSGDANLCIGQLVNDKNVHVFPPDHYSITTMKKRTYLQAQYKKSEIEIKESKGFILSNAQLRNSQIIKLGGKCGGQINPMDRIPSSSHPFDHFIITSRIETKSD